MLQNHKHHNKEPSKPTVTPQNFRNPYPKILKQYEKSTSPPKSCTQEASQNPIQTKQTVINQ